MRKIGQGRNLCHDIVSEYRDIIPKELVEAMSQQALLWHNKDQAKMKLETKFFVTSDNYIAT